MPERPITNNTKGLFVPRARRRSRGKGKHTFSAVFGGKGHAGPERRVMIHSTGRPPWHVKSKRRRRAQLAKASRKANRR